MRHINRPQEPIKNSTYFILLAAVWGVLVGFIMLLLFSAPVINLKYVLRYAGRSILFSSLLGGGLCALLGYIQLNLIKKGKI